jgi:hypothetical protein
LGWTAWPTLLMGLLALVLFLLSMHLLLTAESWGRVIAAALIYALCNLTYEPFYLAFLPFLLILFISDERRLFWQKAVLLFAVQAISVGYNRLMAHVMTNGGAAKTIKFPAFSEFLGTLKTLPSNLLYSAQQTSGLISRASGLLVGVTVALLLVLIVTRQTRAAERYAAVLIASFLAILISVLQFSLASYGLSGIGEASRTTIAVCIWFAVSIYCLFENLLDLDASAGPYGLHGCDCGSDGGLRGCTLSTE